MSARKTVRAAALGMAIVKLHRVRAVVACMEFAATADADTEIGPVAFVAVELIDRVLEDLAPFARAVRLSTQEDPR